MTERVGLDGLVWFQHQWVTFCDAPRCRARHPSLSPHSVPLAPLADPSALLTSAVLQPLQTSGSPAAPGPAAPSFSSLLQTAYASQDQGQGPGGLLLLDEGVQAQLRAALLRLPMHQALRAAKHLLLYIRSAVENFAQVSAALVPCITAHASVASAVASHFGTEW